jgi:hypothetical protein
MTWRETFKRARRQLNNVDEPSNNRPAYLRPIDTRRILLTTTHLPYRLDRMSIFQSFVCYLERLRHDPQSTVLWIWLWISYPSDICGYPMDIKPIQICQDSWPRGVCIIFMFSSSIFRVIALSWPNDYNIGLSVVQLISFSHSVNCTRMKSLLFPFSFLSSCYVFYSNIPL